MSGTKEGGQRARDTNKANYGADFYAKIGAKGGQKSTTGGFWYKKYVEGDVEAIRAAGQVGGTLGTRSKEKSPHRALELLRAKLKAGTISYDEYVIEVDKL